jgi:hypothetical protein
MKREKTKFIIRREKEKKSINMTSELLIICFVLLLVNLSNTCFKEINHINYLFTEDMSQTKIPLLPLDCLHCQSAYQVSIDETNFLLFNKNKSSD